MDNITNTMTAKSPSSFGMPACGHAPVATEWTLRIGATSVVRDRQVDTGITKGDMGLALAYFPGTHAWRPPTS
jgi:hypothetical protein